MILITTGYSLAQISPGPLSKAHSDLEGISNCTQCHDLGNKVPEQKCLACHKEIQTLIWNQKGYHASKEVKSKTCVDCHSEHHGLKFDMVRFDKDNFNHNLTGYKLEGQHKIIDCRECHQPDNISDSKIRKREDTFLGLKEDCLSCHDDFHQGSLKSSCTDCHGFEAFRPTVGFNHNDAKFKLKGQHVDVSCLECHPKSVKNGEDFQQFVGLEFNDCKSCHDDVHKNNLPGACNQCHTESSFTTFIGQKYFNHNLTNFKLNGKHKSVNCFECHSHTKIVSSIFQDLKEVGNNNCVKCHDDIHEGKFGLDCAKCHNEESFLSLNSMDFFDHRLTNYPLEGQHIGVDCKQCHAGKLTDELQYNECKDCHADFHNGQFVENNVSPDCNTCHTLEEKFTYTTFGFDEHDLTAFPLEGAHMATPCFACHVSEDKWEFDAMGTSCVDCHDDIHKGLINEKYYPESTCLACHSNESWTEIDKFDHKQTNFTLDGKHLETSCRSCHFKEDEMMVVQQIFDGLPQNCISCHENIHGNQFSIGGVTDCKRCHSTDSWDQENFNHDNTAFPLTGKHSEIDCRQCHKEEELINGELKVIFKINNFECVDCHS